MPTTTPPVRVLILNAVAMNGGDGALLDALIARARDAFGEDARVTVADATPEVSTQAFPELRFVPTVLGDPPGSTAADRARPAVKAAKAVRAARLVVGIVVAHIAGARAATLVVSRADRAAVRAYREADVVLSSGGTSLVEHYQLFKRWASFEFAYAEHRPLVLFTQSLGPFTQRLNRVMVRRLARRARLILLRDERSRRHLREIGASVVRCTVSADAAFGFAHAPAAAGTAPAAVGAEAAVGSGTAVGGRSDAHVPSGPPRRVAISVRHWPYAAAVQGRDTTEPYRAAIVALAERIVRGGGTVVFLSTCQGVPTYTDDSVEARLIASRIAEDCQHGVRVDGEHRRAEALIEEVRGVDVVVATRMHMAILSLMAQRPVLPIAYEFKTEELFRGLGEPGLAIPLQDVDPQVLVDAYDAFIARLPQLQATLQRGVQAQRQIALGVSDQLRRAVPEFAR